MKTYVLSLSGSSRRVSFIEKNAKLLHDYTFFDAIPFESICKRNRVSYLSESEISCAYSHNRILKALIQSKEKFFLVLEDDVTIDEEKFFAEINSLKEFILTDQRPLVIFLGGMNDIPSHKKYFIGKKENIKNIEMLLSFKSDEYLQRTCCYLINRQAANIILKANHPVRYVADAWHHFNKEKKIFYYKVANEIVIHPEVLDGENVVHTRKKDFILLRLIKILYRNLAYFTKLILVRF